MGAFPTAVLEVHKVEESLAPVSVLFDKGVREPQLLRQDRGIPWKEVKGRLEVESSLRLVVPLVVPVEEKEGLRIGKDSLLAVDPFQKSRPLLGPLTSLQVSLPQEKVPLFALPVLSGGGGTPSEQCFRRLGPLPFGVEGFRLPQGIRGDRQKQYGDE